MLDPRTLVPGQYVTVATGGFVARAIRFVTRAPVNHAYVYVGPQDPTGEDIVEATPRGVRLGYARSYDLAKSYPSKTIPDKGQSMRMRHYALGSVGEPYGYIADAFIGIRDLFDLPVIPWFFKLHSVTASRECAQFADLVGIVAEIKYFRDVRLPGSVSPGDLYHLDYR